MLKFFAENSKSIDKSIRLRDVERDRKNIDLAEMYARRQKLRIYPINHFFRFENIIISDADAGSQPFSIRYETVITLFLQWPTIGFRRR